jgi:hypothetical protein
MRENRTDPAVLSNSAEAAASQGDVIGTVIVPDEGSQGTSAQRGS